MTAPTIFLSSEEERSRPAIPSSSSIE
jgi:hypothetical protein